jgi:hypothetical protein
MHGSYQPDRGVIMVVVVIRFCDTLEIGLLKCVDTK